MRTFKSLRETYMSNNTVQTDDVPDDPMAFVEIKPKKSKISNKENESNPVKEQRSLHYGSKHSVPVPRKPKDEYESKVEKYLKKKYTKESVVPDSMRGKQKPYVSSDGKGNHEVLGNSGQTKASFTRKEHGMEAKNKAIVHLKKNYDTYMKEESISETKSAPKGYHFTSDGKLKRGDADADGDGGPKLRSDPLDKQRSKVPAVSEESNTHRALRDKAMKLSNKIDSIVKSGGRVGLYDPLSIQHKIVQLRIKKAKQKVSEEAELDESDLHSQFAAFAASRGGKMTTSAERKQTTADMMAKRAKEAASRPKTEPQKTTPYKPLGGRDEMSGRSYSESIDQIDELKTGTLLRYHSKAGKSGLEAGMRAAKSLDADNYVSAIPDLNKRDKRMKGQMQAMSKIQKRYATDEATGDNRFDSIMKTIKKGTAKQATADRKEQRQQSQQRARDAFGPNPAAGLGIRKSNVREGVDLNKVWESIRTPSFEDEIEIEVIDEAALKLKSDKIMADEIKAHKASMRKE